MLFPIKMVKQLCKTFNSIKEYFLTCCCLWSFSHLVTICVAKSFSKILALSWSSVLLAHFFALQSTPAFATGHSRRDYWSSTTTPPDGTFHLVWVFMRFCVFARCFARVTSLQLFPWWAIQISRNCSPSFMGKVYSTISWALYCLILSKAFKQTLTFPPKHLSPSCSTFYHSLLPL